METNDKINIMLVNDAPAQLTALGSVLDGQGHNLVTAGSGKEALKCLLRQDFALILLDVNMPDLDGFETAELIRQRERSAHTPIIFVTAIHTAEMDLTRGYGLGAVDYLFTPVVPEILRAKVQAFADLFRMTQEVKRQASELAAINLMLEHEVAERKRAEKLTTELNRDLQSNARQLEEANRELEAFSYTVSHDLRAPLRRIEGFGSALLEDYADKLDGRGRENLEHILSSSKRMTELIKMLLELSRLVRTELHREPVDLSVIARAIALELQAGQPQRQVDFVIHEGLVAEGDGRLLRVALENLLGNAWKFTSRHDRSRIELGAARIDERTLAYFVRDDGAGFDMEYARKLFQPFQRLHKEEEFPGTGIGLATVQRIIRRHGGRIWAEGGVEKGATFFFTLQEVASRGS